MLTDKECVTLRVKRPQQQNEHVISITRSNVIAFRSGA